MCICTLRVSKTSTPRLRTKPKRAKTIRVLKKNFRKYFKDKY